MSIKRVATDQEKREFLLKPALDDAIAGENPLSRALERSITVEIEPEDYEALLNRMMRTPVQAHVKELLDDVFLKESMASLLSETQLELKAAKAPTVVMWVEHFPAPPKADGGWLKCKDTHPCMQPWIALYEKYEECVATSRNKLNIRRACQENLPIDIVITKCYDAKGKTSEERKKKLLRFVVFEPLAENQKGFDSYIEFKKENDDK